MLFWKSMGAPPGMRIHIRHTWTHRAAVDVTARASMANLFFFFFFDFYLAWYWPIQFDSVRNGPKQPWIGPIHGEIRFFIFIFIFILLLFLSKKTRQNTPFDSSVFFPILFHFHVLFVYFFKKFPNNLVIVSI